MPFDRFLQLREETAGIENIDGLGPGIAEFAPVLNPRTSLSEGNMRIVGVFQDSVAEFGGLNLAEGGPARIEDLGPDHVYLNDDAAEELDAVEGDEVRIFLGGGELTFRVKGILEQGGLAGPDPTLAMSLERAQQVFGREGQINSIAVSNTGGVFAGAEHSEEVTRQLRVLLADRGVAGQLQKLLSAEDALDALEQRERDLDGPLQADLAALRGELAKDQPGDALIGLLADEAVSDEVLEALGQGRPDRRPEAGGHFVCRTGRTAGA